MNQPQIEQRPLDEGRIVIIVISALGAFTVLLGIGLMVLVLRG